MQWRAQSERGSHGLTPTTFHFNLLLNRCVVNVFNFSINGGGGGGGDMLEYGWAGGENVRPFQGEFLSVQLYQCCNFPKNSIIIRE